MSAQSFPRPAPMMADVGVSISGMPARAKLGFRRDEKFETPECARHRRTKAMLECYIND